MLRSIGFATVLALLMVGCGGGGSGGASSPPPTTLGYTVGGTVSGLVGSGLTLAICPTSNSRSLPKPCHGLLQVSANGAFILPDGPAGDYIITQQPSSPTQRCVISNDSISVTVNCAEYSHVTSNADNTLLSYSVDAATGALVAIGTPTATGTSPYAIVGLDIGEDKRYVYVGNEGSNDVSAFAVNPATGSLTTVSGSPFPAGTDPKAMALFGPYLYVASAGSSNISVYPIDVNTGALAVPSTIPTGKSPTSIAIDPFSGVVFVANHGGSNDISAFYSFNLTPVPGSPFPAGGNPLSLAVGGVGAGGKFLYTANPDATNPSISGFSVDPTSGVLSPLSGSPFPMPVSHYIATDQTGAYLYVISGTNIVGYAIDVYTGALTALPGFPVSTGANAYSMSIDQTNQFLYVANDGAANISGFRLDASTGALTPMADSPFPTGNRPDFLATF